MQPYQLHHHKLLMYHKGKFWKNYFGLIICSNKRVRVVPICGIFIVTTNHIRNTGNIKGDSN